MLLEAFSNIPDTFKMIQRHSGQCIKPQTHSRHICQTLSEAFSNITDTFKMLQRQSGQSRKPQTHSPNTLRSLIYYPRLSGQTLLEPWLNIPELCLLVSVGSVVSTSRRRAARPEKSKEDSDNIRDGHINGIHCFALDKSGYDDVLIATDYLTDHWHTAPLLTWPTNP